MKYNCYRRGLALAVICVMSLSGCGMTNGNGTKHTSATVSPASNEIAASSSPYLSITLSNKVGSKFVTHFFVYNIKTKKIDEVAQIPMTAQYPLGAVDESNHTLYCSERDSTGSDQLVAINLASGKTKTLTHNVFAINYLIPIGNKIVMAAQLKGSRQITLCSYDLKSRVLNVWNKKDHDTFVQSLTMDPYTNKLYATLYSWKERLEKSNNATKEHSLVVLPPINHVMEYSSNGQKVKELFSVEEQVGTFVVSNEGERAMLRSAPHVFQTKKLYSIDLKTGKKVVLSIPNYIPSGDVFFRPDDQGIFFIAYKANDPSQSNGLYYYDFNTKQVSTILSKPNSFINNFALYTTSIT